MRDMHSLKYRYRYYSAMLDVDVTVHRAASVFKPIYLHLYYIPNARTNE